MKNGVRKMWLQENPNIQRPIPQSNVIGGSGSKHIKGNKSMKIKCPNCP